MKPLSFSVLLFLAGFAAVAQDCACPAGINNDNEGRPNRVFRFANGKEIGLCGYNGPEQDSSYTQFTLFECGSNKAIEVWTVNQTCQAEMKKDELYIKELFGLAIGQSFSTIWRPYLIHKYSYKNGALHEEEYFRKDLGRYTAAQQEEVMTEYKKLPEGSKENMMHVANMLFWAIASGNKAAEPLLKNMPDKFGPFEGVIGEEWKAIYGTYEKWKAKNGAK